MEVTNLHPGLHLRGRRATAADAPAIHRLLRRGAYSHLHVDWRLPVEWLDTGGAVLVETTVDHPDGPDELQACLAVGADPPPAAWVRIFALADTSAAIPLLQAMLGMVLPHLQERNVSQLGWLPREGLPAEWVESAGFHQVNQVETYVKKGVDPPKNLRANEAVDLGPVQTDDLPRLAALEAEAFAPLWRHSVDGLRLGWQHARSFHVARLNGEVVGFQYSSDSERPQAAHLVRLTVSPRVQGRGIGSALMLAALDSYRRQGVRVVSLNTQTDNLASKHLYEKFGFKSVGHYLPVWSLDL